MATVKTDNQHYQNIASAIREKLSVQTQYKPSEMAAAIAEISGGGDISSFTPIAGRDGHISVPSRFTATFTYPFTKNANARYYLVAFSLGGHETQGDTILNRLAFALFDSELTVIAAPMSLPLLSASVSGNDVTINTSLTLQTGEYDYHFLACWLE